MKRAFIIHGWNSQPLDGWKPWLNNELNARGFTVRTPHLPNTKHPDRYRWVEELAKVIGAPDADCHLVGHSLGCTAILRYVESLPAGSKVGRLVLVAGFTEDLGIEDVANFVDEPFDFAKIKAAAGKIFSIRSDADPYISGEQFDRLEKALGAKKTLVKGGKHFSGSEGCYQLPQALEALLG
jgi:uncharacterized protein